MMKGARIGEGRTAEIYAWGDNQVLKLFRSDVPEDWVLYEGRIARLAYEAGANAPAISTDIVEVDGRNGLIYDRVNGVSMVHQLTQKPWLVWKMGRLMAELHAAMHRTTSNELPAQYDRLCRSIQAAPHLSDDDKARVVAYLDTLPAGNAVCHGDFHPDNIILTANGAVILDWMNAARGNPLGDVARTSLMLSSKALPPGIHAVKAFVIQRLRRIMHSVYIHRYCVLTGITLEQIDAWWLPVAASRLWERIPEETDWLMGIVESQLRKL
jgi:aminoglycoside phosphotransferase (APT) family kinase protein